MSDSENQKSTTSSTGKCPVDHKNASTSLWNVLGLQSTSSGNPTPSQQDDSKNIPASLEEAAKYAQTPHPGQKLPLSVHRAVSSIPRGATSSSGEGPHHQSGTSDTSKWVYPSEQQVFNAMKRKGWQGIEEEAIPSFLQIHNSVNERSWRQLREWESNADIQLVRFEGRPNVMTPKAWILSTFFFQPKPFDRHDWYIDNGVEHEKRYVLDFYMYEDSKTFAGNSNSVTASIPRVEIDVRPALDTPQAFAARAQRLAQDFFPGITTEWKKYQASKSAQQPTQNKRS